MRCKKNPTPKPIGFIPKKESLNSVRILFPSPTRSFDVELSSEVFSTHHTDSIELPASTPLIPEEFISDIPINIVILFLLFYMMMVLYLCDDGIFTLHF